MQISRDAGFTAVDRADKFTARSGEKATSMPINEKPASQMPTVSISGEALLRQRLFHVTDPNRDLPVLGKAECGRSYPDISFLTLNDRALLGDAYAWASSEGADLAYVDELGFKLAHYREKDNGRISGRDNQGMRYDGEGHKVYFSFTEKDTATAKRIVESEALRTTRLDQGFIRYITDKDYSSMYHNDFEFMEQVINRFSSKSDEPQTLMPRFAKRDYLKNNFVVTRSKEKYALGHNSGRENEPGFTATKTTKPKPVTVESLHDDMRAALFKAMNVTSFKSLFALLFGGKR
ncbi:hypothetical protein [Pseudomonas viridiflava]|uniref:hypothetical protein n=1 Tax=Pseudomonas viridiflava TaxID=33069 RepID=UPI001F11C943|nr:hypothetical protein [Pseudomonas viridiflava]